MDRDARGRPDLGYFFSEAYQRRTGDRDFFRLLPFYRCYRAFVRGKVLSFRLNEAEFSEEERSLAAARARDFFELAQRYASRLRKPVLVAVGGLSGTGKTAVSRAIASELGMRVISADAVRKSLFGTAKTRSPFGEGPYTAEANRLTYQNLFKNAVELMKDDHSVVLDATFRDSEILAMVDSMAAKAGVQLRLIECHLEPELVRSRLAEREAKKDGLSDATWETYLRQREEGATLKPFPGAAHLILDTSESLRDTSRTASDWLRAHDIQ